MAKLTEAQLVVLTDLTRGGYIVSDGRTYARWCWVFDLKEPHILPTFKSLLKRGFVEPLLHGTWDITDAGRAALSEAEAGNE